MLKAVYNTDDRKKNNELVNIIKSELDDLKDEIDEMPEDETEIEELNKILDIVGKIPDSNKQSQVVWRLKIFTPDQMLSRLTIFLVQLKPRNDSGKLKNKIRQPLFSLHYSKN